MSIDDIKPGDLIVIKPRRFSYPHVGLVTPVYGNLVIYEFTMQPRPTCVRTGRTDPKGLQAHFLKDFLEGPAKVSCLSLVAGLYVDEEDRLLQEAEVCLGRGPEAWGGKLNGPDRYNAASFVAHIWQTVGVLQTRPQTWSPDGLIATAKKRGIVGNPLSLN